jgi:predicted nucleotide-binding protein (sugar kinase/HSP70/actin superfamily)
MDDHGQMMASVIRSNGLEAEALPMADRKSVEIGRQFTTGKECYPCILTTGDIVKKTREPDFDPERAAFFMGHASGPCRFGQYHKFHRMVLDDLGYDRVPLVLVDQTERFASHMAAFGPGFLRRCWDLLLVVDSMLKMVREIRPYEQTPGETDRVYGQCLRELGEVVERRGDYFACARGVRRRLAAVPVDRSERRPIIGIVGEIYVRSNEFANNFLVRRIEALGGQAILPTFQEWLSYTAYGRRQGSLRDGHYLRFLREWTSELGARWEEGRVARIFDGAVHHMAREERTAAILEMGRRYLSPAVLGEAILSMGRAVEYAMHGLDGIVNVGPFGCMPGALVDGLLASFRRDHEDLPLLKLAFDGVDQAGEETQLEAFIHQARQHLAGTRDRDTDARASG